MNTAYITLTHRKIIRLLLVTFSVLYLGLEVYLGTQGSTPAMYRIFGIFTMVLMVAAGALYDKIPGLFLGLPSVLTVTCSQIYMYTVTYGGCRIAAGLILGSMFACAVLLMEMWALGSTDKKIKGIAAVLKIVQYGVSMVSWIVIIAKLLSVGSMDMVLNDVGVMFASSIALMYDLILIFAAQPHPMRRDLNKIVSNRVFNTMRI